MTFDIKLTSLYICVSDMDRAIAFYEALLQRPVARRNEIFSVFDFGGLRFCLFHNGKMNESVTWGDNCLPSFEVSDMEALLAKLKSLDAPIVFPLTRIYDNWVLEFSDPEGNDIEVYCKA